MPAERRAAEPRGVIDYEEDELERLGKLTKSSSVAVAEATVAFRVSSARRKRA